jgi:hypothetical protein
MTVDALDTGWSADVYVADAPASTLAGWGKARASKQGLGKHATFDLGSAHGKAVLLWITHLPQAPSGGGFALRVSEVRLA